MKLGVQTTRTPYHPPLHQGLDASMVDRRESTAEETTLPSTVTQMFVVSRGAVMLLGPP